MIEGRLYATGSTASRPVRLAAQGGLLVLLASDAVPERIDPATVKLSSRLGSVPRRLTLADGRVFETADNDGVDRLFRGRRGQSRAGVMARLEHFSPWLIVVVVVLGLTSFVSLRFGVPVLADLVAEGTPYEVEESLGRGALAQFDEILTQPSALPAARREPIEQSFARLTAAAHLPYGTVRLEFRKGGEIGANAVALPGGIVVLTDELVDLLGTNAALTAVLAHELGHVHHRHGLRMLTRAAGLGVISLALTGDIASLSSLVVGFAQSTVRNAFSRGFEADADTYSVELMRQAGLAPGALATALEKLNEKYSSDLPRYLMSHPPTTERIAAVRARAAALEGR